MRKDWTKLEEKKLKEMKANNDKIEYIAKKLNRSFWSVANKSCRVNGSRTYKPWTEEEFELVKTMYADSYTYRQIASELGRSRGSIQGKLQEERKCKKVLSLKG